jgi:uridine kinase
VTRAPRAVVGRAPRAVVGRAPRAVVGIDGIDGSGKSELARRLAAACEAAGEPIVTFHVDDFRRPLAALSPGDDEAAAYYDRYYDFAALDACLAAFVAGAPAVTLARFDPAREQLAAEAPLPFGAARLALVEGVFVLRSPVVAAGALVRLEISEPEARRRILARDLARGRSREVVEHRMNHRYFPAQRAYIAAFDPLRHADVVIDNERWDAPVLVRWDGGRLPPPVASALGHVVPS